MPVYNDPDEPPFARTEARDRWFSNVLLAEYGELDAPREVPSALNWLELLPSARRYDFEEAECGAVYVSPSGGDYACSVWDVSGEGDEPWAVFVVDVYGARWLPEYSLLDEDAPDAVREAVLKRAVDELPDRLEAGEFTRTGTPVAIPDWLLAKPSEENEAED
jgi:hypothetical protein